MFPNDIIIIAFCCSGDGIIICIGFAWWLICIEFGWGLIFGILRVSKLVLDGPVFTYDYSFSLSFVISLGSILSSSLISDEDLLLEVFILSCCFNT